MYILHETIIYVLYLHKNTLIAGRSSNASACCCVCAGSGSRAQHLSSRAPNMSKETPNAHSSHADRSLPLFPSKVTLYQIPTAN